MQKGAQENNLQNADSLQKKAYIFGSLFIMANRLQALGDALAQLIGTSRQNAKKMAAILEREGYVVFEKDDIDARILRVTLTEKCTEHFSKRSGLEIEFITKLFSGMEEELIDRTAAGFSALLNNISEMENVIK